MSLITTGTFPKDLLPGVNSWFGAKYNAVPKQYEQIFEMRKSDRAYEEDVAYAGPGIAPQKNEGEAVSYSSANQLFVARFVPSPFGLGMKITREARDDGLTLKIAKHFSEMIGDSMAHTKNIVAANVLNNAFNTSYTMGSDADGKPLCSTTHPSNVGSQSNRLSADADLSEASLEQMIYDIEDMRGFDGKRAFLSAKKLIIHNANQFEAHRILQSDLRVGVADNDPNAIKDMRKIPEGFVVNKYLTDADAYFVTTTAPDSLIGYNRVAPEMSSDNEFDTDILKMKGYERYSFGWKDWKGIYGTPGA